MTSRKIQQLKQGQYILTLPADTIEPLGWRKGTLLEFIATGSKDTLLLKKVEDKTH